MLQILEPRFHLWERAGIRPNSMQPHEVRATSDYRTVSHEIFFTIEGTEGDELPSSTFNQQNFRTHRVFPDDVVFLAAGRALKAPQNEKREIIIMYSS